MPQRRRPAEESKPVPRCGGSGLECDSELLTSPRSRTPEPKCPLPAKDVDPNAADVANLLSELCEQFLYEGNQEEANLCSRRATLIRSGQRAVDYEDLICSMNNLSTLYIARKAHDKAVALLKQALEYGSKLRPGHPHVATVLNNLAGLHEMAGNSADAERLMRQLLAISEAAFGPSHPDVGGTLHNLALILQRGGRPAEAEPLFQRSLGVLEGALGRRHPSVATLLANLAELYARQGRHAEAAPLLKQIEDIRLVQSGGVRTPRRCAGRSSLR
eukprot:tig00020848_g14577.t1